MTQHLQPDDYPRVDDEATIVVTHPSAQATIQASWNWPIGRKDLELCGTGGYVVTDNRSAMRIRVSERATARGLRARLRHGRAGAEAPSRTRAS